MLVAPTELKHAPFRELTRNGKGSNKPETMGADFAFNVKGEWYGVQRKETKDFIASVNDGRLAQETKQKSALAAAVLLVEGNPRWSLDGAWLGDSYHGSWTREKHTKQLLTAQFSGWWVAGTADTRETAAWILAFKSWVEKEEHTSLLKRGPMANPWGTKNNRDYQLHLIMGLPGVGYELATRILDTIGMPFGVKVTREQLISVDKIGAKKADAILEALEAV